MIDCVVLSGLMVRVSVFVFASVSCVCVFCMSFNV